FRFLHRDPPADPEIAAVCQELADRGTAGIADLIRFGAADATSVKGITVDDGAWILARATQSACGGVATWWYENRDVPRERVVELVFMLLWQGFEGMLKQASAGCPRPRSYPGSTSASLRPSTGRCRGNCGRPQRLWRAPCRQGHRDRARRTRAIRSAPARRRRAHRPP